MDRKEKDAIRKEVKQLMQNLKNKGWTQLAIGIELDCNQSAISRMKAGEIPAPERLKILRRLAARKKGPSYA